MDPPNVTLKTESSLNPDTLLPSPSNESVSHKCLEVLKTVYSSRLDLSDQPLTQADWNLLADGGSFLGHGQC